MGKGSAKGSASNLSRATWDYVGLRGTTWDYVGLRGACGPTLPPSLSMQHGGPGVGQNHSFSLGFQKE